MARVNGRMPRKTCSRGCCDVGETDHQRRAFLKQELELADEELRSFPHDKMEDDPDWDGKLTDWDFPEDIAVRVKFIPAPEDDSGW